ncbi:MAG: hypothetical protein JSS72_05975 [Armatimonadetes bacterium]|nr:hypothetical protein [Armatimonadota bacterium]
MAQVAETSFEKQRGVSSVEVRSGYSQLHLEELATPILSSRLEVLRRMNAAGISLDFMKMAPDGISFLVADGQAAQAQQALEGVQGKLTIHHQCSIVVVYAVNIRDEEGMIARIAQEAIRSDVDVDQIGDMHDRVLLVVPTESAQRLADGFRKAFLEGAYAN